MADIPEDVFEEQIKKENIMLSTVRVLNAAKKETEKETEVGASVMPAKKNPTEVMSSAELNEVEVLG